MNRRLLISIGLTVVIVRLLYGWRWLTFAIWTNAALLDRSQPLLTVAAIEALVVAGVFVVCKLTTIAVAEFMGRLPRR